MCIRDSQKTLDKLENKEAFDFRFLGNSKVKGKQELISLYECINGDAEDLYTTKINYISDFEDAVHLVVSGENSKAKTKLEELSISNQMDMVIQKILNKM